MKNINQLLYSLENLFGEKRMTFVAIGPEARNIEQYGSKESGEKIPERIERLKVIEKMFSKEESDKVEKTTFEASTPLFNSQVYKDEYVFGIIELDRLTKQCALTIQPSDGATAQIQQDDLIQSFQESVGDVQAVQAKIDANKGKFDTVSFKKGDDKMIHLILSKGDTKEDIFQFDVKSKQRRSLEENRETTLENFATERKNLTLELADIAILQTKAEKFKVEKLVNELGIDPTAIETVKEELLVGKNPEKIEYIIHKKNTQGDWMAIMTKVAFSYQDGKFSYEVHGPSNKQVVKGENAKMISPELSLIDGYLKSWETRTSESPAQESGKEFVAKVQIDGKTQYVFIDIDEEENAKFYFADNTEITDKNLIVGLDIQAINSALKKVKDKKLEEKVEEVETAELEKASAPKSAPKGTDTPTVAIEKIKDKIVKKFEVITDPKSKLRTLTITTKKGTILTYSEIKKRTNDDQAIWRYSNSDEYYLDSGLRVDPSGLSYEGSGQKKSKILGEHVKIARDVQKDLEERSGAKIQIAKKEFEPQERLVLSKGPSAVESSVDLIFRIVKEKLEKGETSDEYSTLEGITKALKREGETLTKYLGNSFDKISINFHGTEIEWTKENGFFKPEDPLFLKGKVVKILKSYLDTDLYEKFFAKEKTNEHERETQELITRAENEWKQESIKKLSRSYSILEFDKKSFSEEDIAENWKRLNGTTRVTELLTYKFVAKNSVSGMHGAQGHEVPELAGKIVSEWSNSEVNFEELFKFVKPNLSRFDALDSKAAGELLGTGSVDLNEALTDPKKIIEILEKGLNGPKKDNLDVQVFMDKIFSDVVNPTIDLLESMERLTMSDAKEVEEPKTAEGTILDLMKNEPYSKFSLESGNKFKLNKNSKELSIGVKDGMVETTKESLLKLNLTQYKDLINGLDNKLLLQAIFLSISPEELVRQNCLERNTNNEIMLVKLPSELTETPEYIIDRIITLKDGKEPKADDNESDLDVLKNKIDIVDKQTKILKQLAKLCKTEDERNWLKSTVDYLKGAGDFVYMTQLDGSTTFKDKNRLNRQMTGDAALNFMLYNGSYYDVDEVRNIKTFNIEKLQENVNKFIELGALQKFPKKGNEFNKYLETLKIRNLATDKISTEQVKAFQVGLLVEYATKYDKQNEELFQSTKNPALKGFLLWAISTGAKTSDIKEVATKLAGGINLDTSGNVTGGGIGIGQDIPLGNGFSLQVGGGLSTGGVDAGTGVSYTFKGPGNSEWRLGVFGTGGTSGAGIGAGAMNTHRYGETAYEGIALAGVFAHSAIGISPAVGYGVGRNYDYAVEIKMKENIEGADLTKIQEALKSLDNGGGETAKTALLDAAKDHPTFKKLFETKVAGSSLDITEDDIVSLIRFQLMGVQEQSAEGASQSLAQTDWVPVSKIILGVPSYIEFSIPAGTVSRPLLRSEARVLCIASSMATEKAVQEKLKAQDLKGERMAIEDIANVYITADGRIGTLAPQEGRQEINFTGLGDNTFLNEQLKGVHMRVKQGMGETERILQINDDGRNGKNSIELEVHVDPTLEGKLAVHTTKSNELALEGNIEDLVITRERFIFPAKTGKYGSSVKDVITIRKKESVQGGRDRLWIMAHEEAYLERLPGHTFAKKEGRSARFLGQSRTVFDVQGWNSMENEQIRRQITDARREELSTSISDPEAQRKANLVNEGREGLPTTKFEATTEATQIMIKEGIDKAFESDNFKKAISAIIDNPKAMSQYLAEHSTEIFSEKLLGEDNKLSDLERNLSIQYVTRRYFIDLASKALKNSGLSEQDLKEKGETAINHIQNNPKFKKQLVKYINKTRDILIRNAKYVAKGFEQEFDEAISRLRERGVNIDKNLTGKSVAEQMVNDITGNVAKVDENTSPAELLNHPLRTLDVDAMWEGSTVLYGTHKSQSKEGGKDIPAVARSLQAMVTAERTVRPAGFLKGTSTIYENGSDMERILTETASPLPEISENTESYKELLNSEFAVRIANMGALVFMMEESDYKKTMEAFKNPSLTEKPEYKVALKAFHEACSKFRADQLAGRPTEIHYKDLTILISLDKKVRSIAWSDCGNAGFETDQGGTVEILKGGKAIAISRETLKRLDPEVKKIYATFGVGINITPKKSKAKEDKKEEPDKEPKNPAKTIQIKTADPTKITSTGGKQVAGPVITIEGTGGMASNPDK